MLCATLEKAELKWFIDIPDLLPTVFPSLLRVPRPAA